MKKGSGFGKSKTNPLVKEERIHYNFWGMLAQIGTRMVDRGQALVFLGFVLVVLIIAKLPPEDIRDLLERVLDRLERMYFTGYASTIVISLSWFWHARWQRRTLHAEMHRLGREKIALAGKGGGETYGNKPQEIMDILIIIFMGMVFWHLIYEGILAPSFRLHCRFQLFTMRDELRGLKEELDSDLSDDVFDILNDSINGQLGFLRELTPYNLYLFRQTLRVNAELRARIENRVRTMESCQLAEISDFTSRLRRVHNHVLMINTGGWALYVVPLVMLNWALDRFRRFFDRSLFAPTEAYPSCTASA